MRKNLTPIGNSYGLIIDRAVLDLLKIEKDTPLDISTDGDALIVRPVRERGEHKRRVKAATKRMMDAHDATLKKLAK